MTNSSPALKFQIAFLLFIIGFPATLKLYGGKPDLRFRYISSEDGLSNSTIECIYQDSRGFMWFGTRDGLNKYDGYQMTVYRNNPKDSRSISDNYIRCIYEDKQKNFWIATSNGLNLFKPEKGIFISYKHKQNDDRSLSGNNVSCIFEDSRNNLWISTSGGGLNWLNRKTGTFRHFRSNPDQGNSISSDFVNDIFEDSRKNLWLATENGLNLFNAGTRSFKQYPLENGISNVRLVREDKSGYLWVGTEDKGLIVFKPGTINLRHYAFKDKVPGSVGSDLVRSITFDRKGNTWIGCINGGLNLFNKETHSFYHYTDDLSKPGSLSQRTVSAAFEDNQGDLWIGTHRGGINLYAPDARRFQLYRQEQGRNSLSYNDIKTFFEDRKGNIWIGTDGGLNKLNRRENSFKHYRYNPYSQTSLSCDAILDINEDLNGNLMIATWGGGLNVMDEQTGTFTRFVNDPSRNSTISSNYVQKILKDRKGNFWIATYYGGLNLMDPATKMFTRIVHDPRNQSSLFGNNVVSLNEDRKGNIWIGTDDGGLNCYDVAAKKFRHYFINQQKFPDIRVIFTDSKGRLWVGQSGLYLFDEAKDQFALFTEKGGLANTFIKGILEDEKGFLWISTINGLIKIHPENGTFKKYNKADGLQSQEFEANASLKTRDGAMFFGGINGFNAFYPRNITVSKFTPSIYLTDFQIFNKRVTALDNDSPLDADISMAREISLNYKQSTFSISFAALNFAAPNNSSYAYKLEGFDKQWNYVGNERKASYTNLDYGDYIFKVRVSDNDGGWHNYYRSVKITITPPFWKTTWFRLLAALLLLTMVYFFLNFRKKLEMDKLEERKKDELHQIQLQFFTNISHELRTPLSIILGRLEKIIKEDHSASSSHHFQSLVKNASRLMNLINELMDFRKVESGVLKLKVTNSNIDQFTDEVTDEFVAIAEEKQQHFTLKKEIRSNEVWFDRQVMEKILLNLIQNSIKYTPPGGKISVEVCEPAGRAFGTFANALAVKSNYKSKNYLQIKVKDTGIGISRESLKHLFERYYRITESHIGSGIGLAFVKSLVMLHKGEIYVYSEKDKGTEINILIPSARVDYSDQEIWKASSEEGGVRLESVVPALEHSPSIPEAALSRLIEKANSAQIKKHVLIVDDNGEMRELLKESLLPYYQVTEAEDGMEGLNKAKEGFPDLVISDIMMPGMNGIEFCRLLRECVETSHVPFLFLTAKNSIESQLEGIAGGADSYFAKPINIDLLLLSIKNIFEQRQKLWNHYSKGQQTEIRDLVHSTRDREFMDKLLDVIESRITNPELDADCLCGELGMSRTKLYNKIKSITGQSIGEFIRTVRLRKAREIIVHEDVLITEVIYRVGIQTQSYFTKAFKKEFGKTPSQFIQETKQVKP